MRTFRAYEWRGLLDHRQDVITRGGSTEYFTTSYEYEPGGAVKKAAYPSGTVVENTAGPGGVVDNVKVGDSSSTSLVYQRLSSAANGAPEAVRYIEGLSTVNGARVYDETTLWLKELKVGPGVDPGTGLDNSLVMFGLYYDYEKNGNVKEMNRFWRQTAGADCSSLNGTYTYDKLNRLKTYQFSDTRLGTTVNSYRYLMDEYGNLLAEQRLNGVNPAPGGMSVTVDAYTNRLAGKPHDTLGNLLRVDGPGGAPLDLSYRDQGHVAEVKDVRTGQVLNRYSYDASGKRRVKERLSPAGIVTGVSYAFYEGEDLVCERDAGELIQPEESYARKFLLTDHLGTTRAELTFNASGSPVIAYIHDTMPYGEPILPNPQSSESVLFTGKQRDAESNLDFFGARYYSSTIARWSSPDDIFADNQVEKPASWNLYLYASNNPINRIDRNGRVNENSGFGGFNSYIEYKSEADFTKARDNMGINAVCLGAAILTGVALPALAASLPEGLITSLSIGTANFTNSPGGQKIIQKAAEVATGSSSGPGVAECVGDLIDLFSQGEDPTTIIPDSFTVVRGGQSPMPECGTTFSGSVWTSVTEAAAGVPHGSIRSTTVGAIRQNGGSVTYKPEPINSSSSSVNYQHVNIVEGSNSFGNVASNPVPKSERMKTK